MIHTLSGNLKLCPLCGKPMKKMEVEGKHRDYELWTCVDCVRGSGKKEVRRRKQKC